MAITIKNRALTDFGFYIIVIVTAALAWESQNYMTVESQRLQKQSQDGILGEKLTQLNDVQQRQLDAYLEVNRLLTTFGTTILGALGFVLFGRERARTWTRHRWAEFAFLDFRDSSAGRPPLRSLHAHLPSPLSVPEVDSRNFARWAPGPRFRSHGQLGKGRD